jgi:diguanylate cyclase (GGDEF)-like protein/PAS domain S-box-containing protein
LEGPLADIVLLALLVAFFGIQQRSRPQRYFRFWFAGWILVLCSFLVWSFRALAPHTSHLRSALRSEVLFLGGLAFFLSFVVENASERKTLLLGLLVAFPAGALMYFSHLATDPLWLLASFSMLFEAAMLHLIFTLVPRTRKRTRIFLIASCLAMAVFLVLLNRLDPLHNFYVWILAQIFISAGVLYTGSTRNRGSIEWCVGTAGFLAWGLFYPIDQVLQGDPALLHILMQLWNLPKYAVGFAMTIRIFEGTRGDVVHLADRYKELYEDFRLLYENHPLPMWIYEAGSGDFLSVNAATTQNYGYSHDEFLRMTVNALLLPEPVADAPRQIDADDEAANRTMVRHLRSDGSTLAVELTEHNILFQGREARFVLAVDITEREKLNREIFHRAQHDALTGLPNRMLLEDRIAQCLLRNSRDRKKAVLFTIDADRFKLINDTYGHLVGDETLKAIADRLRTRVRSVDTIARTGGEEFTVIIGGLSNAEDAERIANMFLRLFDTPLVLPNHELKVSVSIGGAVYPDDGTDAETLRKRSDQALYHAKHLGRNRFAFASSEVCASFDKAIAIELALREALRDAAFELFYQPVYDAEGCAAHFEALLRMKAGIQRVYDPATFIPIAEESSLIIPIGNWVVEEVCRHIVQWRDLAGKRVTVAINVTGKQLLQKNFGGFVVETLHRHDLPASAIQFELTETSLMTEPTLMREAMAELSQRGIRFAIDDFGTGYSSLARLADLPISLLKVDRSFIAHLDHVRGRTRRTDGIVAAIIHMSQTLDVQVVAEGVEDDSQLNLLLRRGCDLFQGFYLSAPLSCEEMTETLKADSPSLFDHPNFNHTRVAVSKRMRRTSQLVPVAAPAVDGAA